MKQTSTTATDSLPNGQCDAGGIPLGDEYRVFALTTNKVSGPNDGRTSDAQAVSTYYDRQIKVRFCCADHLKKKLAFLLISQGIDAEAAHARIGAGPTGGRWCVLQARGNDSAAGCRVKGQAQKLWIRNRHTVVIEPEPLEVSYAATALSGLYLVKDRNGATAVIDQCRIWSFEFDASEIAFCYTSTSRHLRWLRSSLRHRARIPVCTVS